MELFLATLFLVYAFANAAVKVQTLKRINISDKPLTISGFGSGATMASQMQIAYSASFDGAALFSAVWYRCAPFGTDFEKTKCFTGIYNVSKGINDAMAYSRSGKIDNYKNLQNHRLYHHIQRNDETVRPEVRGKTRKFYEAMGIKSENFYIKYQMGYFSMPTGNKSEIPCSQMVYATQDKRGFLPVGTSFCNYYGAFEGLNYLMNNELERPQYPKQITLQPITLFNQEAVLDSSTAKYMDKIGFLYVPTGCQTDSANCMLHIVLHGCHGYRGLIRSEFVKRSGYLQVGEVNNVIMLFPQSIPFDGNPEGCWDVFGSTGEDYATKDGVQMKALGKIITALIGEEKFYGKASTRK